MTYPIKELLERAVTDILMVSYKLREELPESIATIQAKRLISKHFPCDKIIAGISEKLDCSDEAFERLEMFFNRHGLSDDASRISVFFRSVYSIKGVTQYTALPTLTIEYLKELSKK
ncbi:hypothetical protein KFS98_003788 [Salmonella enterica]|nr:hypothetical protein [Salmonella enterica]